MTPSTPDKRPSETQTEIDALLPRRKFSEARAEQLAQRLVRRFISALRKLNNPSMLLSSQDSGLKTVWDEICVQCQVDRFFVWDAYEMTIHAIIDGTVETLPRDEQVDLWLLTDAGWDWLYDQEDDQAQPEIVLSEITDLLRQRLLEAAEEYSNRRIRAYVERC